MSTQNYTENYLSDLLPLYYKRIFPQTDFYRWLSYGNVEKFQRREISFTFLGDVYLRYQSFNDLEDLVQTLAKKYPIKIDIGAVYSSCPKLNTSSIAMCPLEKELVFDIDLTDYDNIRTCCSDDNICSKCWKFMAIACKILDVALREDFGFNNILWVFSGRRGIHCWVCDDTARNFDDNCRTAIAEYLELLNNQKKQLSFEKIHPSIIRALKIIDKYFITILKEQDLLSNIEKIDTFLSFFIENPETRSLYREAMLKSDSTEERWKIFEQSYNNLQKNDTKKSKNLLAKIKLFYTYPRLDINVSKSLNHLLKSPFCVHPKTGKICVPFDPKLVDNFDPVTVPTITTVIDEINAYDAKTEEQEKHLMETNDSTINVNVKDFKKTSLLKATNVFKDFLRKLEKNKYMEESLDF